MSLVRTLEVAGGHSGYASIEGGEGPELSEAERPPHEQGRSQGGPGSRCRVVATVSVASVLLAVALVAATRPWAGSGGSATARGSTPQQAGLPPDAPGESGGATQLWSMPWLDMGAAASSACGMAEWMFGHPFCATTSTTTTTTTTTVTTSTSTTTTGTSTSTTRTTSTTISRTSTTKTTSTSTTSTTTMFPLWPPPSRDLSGKKLLLKSISYAPSPLKRPGEMLPDDDFMSEGTATLWGPFGYGEGRRDLTTMRMLGANAVRLYGNDPSLDHSGFLDEAARNGLGVVIGLSDYPYVQMSGSCIETGFDCFAQIKEQYIASLQNGLLSGQNYHSAIRTVILMNEPDLKFEGGLRGFPGPPEHFCKALISAFDGAISAEQQLGVTGMAPNFSVAFSFGRCALCTNTSMGDKPSIGQMLELRRFMRDPSLLNYTARNDVWHAYQTRFINSLNTQNPATETRSLFLDLYDSQFPTTPVFIGEYHAPNFGDQHTDMKRIMEIAADESTMLMGISFFEFQMRYDKGGGEMSFGMFGLSDTQAIAETSIAYKTYTSWCLTPVKLKEGSLLEDQCGLMEEDVDYVIEGAWSQVIDHIEDAEGCCKQCRQASECEVWTWVRDAGLEGCPSQCWLKGGAPFSKADKVGVVSGSRDAGIQHQNRTDLDIMSSVYTHTAVANAFNGSGITPQQLCPLKTTTTAATTTSSTKLTSSSSRASTSQNITTSGLFVVHYQ